MFTKEKFYADSMAFFNLQGMSPVFDQSERPRLMLAHLTSVPPTSHFHDFDAAFAAHCAFRKDALSNPNVHMVCKKSDLRKTGMGIIFGMQHAPNALTLSRVRKLSNAGVRILSLVYSGTNEYGSGSDSEGGLTESGKQLITWMVACGMILDLSHANRQTALEALDFIWYEQLLTCPMLSHSGCAAVHENPRNTTDDIIKKVSSLRGYVGIPAMIFMTGGALEMLAAHVKHVIEVTGNENCVGIGSDCPSVDTPAESIKDAEKHHAKMIALLEGSIPEGLCFPDRPNEIIEHGSRMFEHFEKALAQLPDCVLGENFQDFLFHSLPRN